MIRADALGICRDSLVSPGLHVSCQATLSGHPVAVRLVAAAVALVRAFGRGWPSGLMAFRRYATGEALRATRSAKESSDARG